MGLWLVVFALGLVAGVGPAAAQPSPRAGDAPPQAPDYKPDARFLKDEPFRKTKQVVQLTGVKSEAEWATVRGAINDVVGFVRLFGITGSNVGRATITGSSPEQMAEIRAARVTWKAFEDQSTAKGRSAMPLEPASGHMAMALDRWEVDSDAALSVRVDFRQTFLELKMIKDPPARILRLHFVKQGGRWLFDGAVSGG
jgi:hypothetical protein